MEASDVLNKLIKELKSSGVVSAVLDSEILLEFVTGKSREFLLINPNFVLSQNEIKSLNKLVIRRKKSEPIAYLVGHKEFFGLDFNVNSNVLIPRPETEILVEKSLEFLKSKNTNRIFKVLDVGTGSGNIIISIAKNLNEKKARFFATDISKPALNVAKRNADINGGEIYFIHSNLFENINGRFDLVVANLPYVPENGSGNLEITYEPENAIFAADKGKRVIKKFLDEAKNHIKKNAMILLEIDPRNAKELEEYAKKYFSNVSVFKDYSDKNRGLRILT